jgi:glycosyltransferase involved in cell wall biosynthesis
MRITVITVCFNASKTIGEALDSVACQEHPDVEHIVIDGGSTDGTQEQIRLHGRRVTLSISERDRGIYDAMNKGIARATGDVIAFLNADDEYLHPHVLSRVAEVMQQSEVDACYANLFYVDPHNTDKVVRVWRSRPYVRGLFKKGWMPAHPTLFVRKHVFDRLGNFDLSFPQQSDFDLTMRFFELGGISSQFVPEYWVRMRAGGVSNRSLKTVVRGNREAWLICKKNNLKVPPWFPLTKVASRLGQLVHARVPPVLYGFNPNTLSR